ncbi:MAG: helix-turn-helix domain-containing protein [Candidatus Neomarinimicrobiota bacterium]|jgi:transcriptional regulator with XRE-family HTH domain
MKSTELVRYRKNHKLSQYDIAELLKVSRGAVAHWEKAEELPERAALWLQKRRWEEQGTLMQKVFDHAVQEEVGNTHRRGQEDSVLNLSEEAEKLLKDRGRTKGNTPDPAYSKERNKKVDLNKVVAPLLNKDNTQLTAAVKEVVEKSLFDQKMDALQLDARIDTFIEKLREAVVDAVKGILGV